MKERTIYLIVFILCFLSWILSPLIASKLVSSVYGQNLVALGQFGDTFGFINSFFSGMALFGVIISIFLQRQELELQRFELQLTRDELAKTAKAQEEINIASQSQRFLGLASTYVDILKKTSDDYKANVSSLPEGFGNWEEDLRNPREDSVRFYRILERATAHLDVAADAIEHLGKSISDPSLSIACMRLIRTNITPWIVEHAKKGEPFEVLRRWLSTYVAKYPSKFPNNENIISEMETRYERYKKFIF